MLGIFKHRTFQVYIIFILGLDLIFIVCYNYSINILDWISDNIYNNDIVVIDENWIENNKIKENLLTQKNKKSYEILHSKLKTILDDKGFYYISKMLRKEDVDQLRRLESIVEEVINDKNNFALDLKLDFKKLFFEQILIISEHFGFKEDRLQEKRTYCIPVRQGK